MTVTVSNPTIEVDTFRLWGWCMLDVFMLPAFIRLGHECQDLLSPCDESACVHRLDLGLYSHLKEGFFCFVFFFFLGGGGGGEESEPMLTPGEQSLLPEAQRRFEPVTLYHAGHRAQHTTD